ncbi:MAG TPA: FAD-binding protein [Syntrophorhabdales bacterium]|nr:FAD-binding protein [Syntrophorhabdales bacterium]
MSDWFEALESMGPAAIAWPYPVRYGVETDVECDVAVLGGGPAGCMAAISAARAGANVVLIDKGHPKRSGGGGVDHWLNTPNPASTITPEECVDWELESYNGYCNGLSRYIAAREGYDTLLEIEQMGGKIRDTGDEFKNAPFRDEKTKFLFAYDYENKFVFRVWGTTFKPAMYNQCRKLGVQIYTKVMVTSLLTVPHGEGIKVVGATAVDARSGEFYVIKARATIDCMAFSQASWLFSSELTGLPYFHPNVVSDGPAIAWRAGARFTMMEKSGATAEPGHAFPHYGTGNPKNTWFPCSMVDANGKEIPWVDYQGRILKDVSERTRPAPGQKFIAERAQAPKYRCPRIIDDLAERIRKGEFTLPLYADLPSMPEHERKAIWGLMVGEEGRSRVPVFEKYTRAGFDASRDLLQSYMLLGGEPHSGLQQGITLPYLRTYGPLASPGGLVTDWNLRTSLEGLYAAGSALYAANYYHHAAATGRYAGRKAAEYALKTGTSAPRQKQIEEEKVRVYAPVARRNGMDWKELRAGLCRVMQNYCSEPKNEKLLQLGKLWLRDIEENVFPDVSVPNPHMLMRVLESFNMLYCDESIIEASLARKASSTSLGFIRQDYPDIDPPEWHKFITVEKRNGKVVTGELPMGFWGPLSDNYVKHNPAYKGFLKG